MSKLIVQVSESPTKINVVENNIKVNVTNKQLKVELGTSGPQGIQGAQGPSGSVSYGQLGTVFDQASASTTWLINHNLGFYPSITVVDSAGTVVEGNYSYPNATTIIANFSNAFSGKAYLS